MTIGEMVLAGSVYEKVLHLILEGEGENLAILRRQVQAVEKISVESTGAGFFITFPMFPDVARVPLGFPRAYGEVNGYSPDTDELVVGSILFIENGRISMLEIYGFGGNELTVPLDVLVFRRGRSFPPPPPHGAGGN